MSVRVHTLLIFLALGLCAGTAAADDTPAPGCPTFEPGKKLGERFSLGTTLKEASAIKPDGIPGWFRPTDPAGQAVRLRFDDKKTLVEFEHPLPPCVAVKGADVQTPTIHALAAALGTCGPEAVNEGGNVITCAGATLVASIGSTAVRVSETAAPAATCGVYVTHGGWTDKTGAHAQPGDRRELADGATVCLSGVPAPLAAGASLDIFKALGRTCTPDARLGGTHLLCDGITYSFEGPKLAFASVTVGPVK